jgi:integrase
MQKIILAKTDNPSVRTALDAFIVSFGLMGANLADLYLATPFQGDKWVYNRKKITSRKAEMRVVIQPQILPYLERLKNGDDKEWWLPELHRLGAKKHTCNEKLNDYLRRWQKSEGLESEDFTFYAARHSWGQYARDLGNDLASVNECLCHKDNLEMGRIYASLSWEQKNDINKSVLDSFMWE